MAALVQCGFGLALVGRSGWREPAVRRIALVAALTAVVVAGLVAASRPGLVASVGTRVTNPDVLQRPYLWRSAARPSVESAGVLEASRRAAFSWLRLTPSSVPYSFWIFRSARRRSASGVMPPSGVRSRNSR